jgi:membrane protein implicated in regulation of membrane protease activity
MATVFWLRRAMTSEQIASDVPGLNDRGHQFVGRSVTVEEAIEGGRGRVRIGDSLWAAEGPDAGQGARMKVTGVKGTVLVVEPG